MRNWRNILARNLEIKTIQLEGSISLRFLNRVGFDVIIGNPPYVRNRDLQVEDKEYLINILFPHKDNTIFINYFMEQSIIS